MALPTLSGSCVNPNVVKKAIMKATVKAPAKLPMKTRPQFRKHAAERDARPLVDQRQRREHEDASQQVEAEQIEHAEADREQQCAQDRLAGVDVDGDGEPGGQRQDGAGHIGADHRVAGGHEDLRFACVHHLGDEFGRCEIRHQQSLLLM